MIARTENPHLGGVKLASIRMDGVAQFAAEGRQVIPKNKIVQVLTTA
jgi:hypothetical protein